MKKIENPTCMFYAVGKSKKELLAYDNSIGGAERFYTDDLFLCDRYNYMEAKLIALDRKIKFYLVEITKTAGKHNKKISVMDSYDLWNHSSVLYKEKEERLWDKMSGNKLKSFIKALNKRPYSMGDDFSMERTRYESRQYSFLRDYEHYFISRSAMPHNIEDEYLGKLNGSPDSYKNWETNFIKLDTIYGPCRPYLILNNNTIRQYIRFVLGMMCDKGDGPNRSETFGYSALYVVKESIDEVSLSKNARPEIIKLLKKWLIPIKVTQGIDGSFLAVCTVFLKMDIVRVEVKVDKKGTLEIIKETSIAKGVYEIHVFD